jgi:MFS-type transporter involved in bile tolerance (Atg22 family)
MRLEVGNNGLTLFNFAPTAFQNLLYQAAGDQSTLYFANSERTINSIVLLSNGISFAIQCVLFLAIGSYADFGNFRPWILIFWTLIAFGIGFGWLAIHEPDQWFAATWMYVFGLVAYQMSLTFWTAAFPRLARNTPELRDKAEDLVSGVITREKYDLIDSMIRNRLQNVAFYVQSIGEIFILAIIVGFLFVLSGRI